MRRRLIILAVALLAPAAALADNNGGATTGAYAQASGDGAVTIVTPITVVQTQGLDFGAITSGAAGSVAIDPNGGGRKVAGGVGAIAVNVGAPATFAISGQGNAAVVIAVGSAITGLGGGMTGVTTTGTLPGALNSGAATFAVGGVLTVPANVPAGGYTGAFTVSVSYP